VLLLLQKVQTAIDFTFIDHQPTKNHSEMILFIGLSNVCLKGRALLRWINIMLIPIDTLCYALLCSADFS